MSEEQDDSSKTEEPSQKKLEDARKKGQTVSTRELNHFCMMLALALFITTLAPHMGKQTIELLTPFISRPETYEMTPAGTTDILRQSVGGALLILAIPLLLTVVAAIAPAVIQGKLMATTEQMKPKLEKISPMAGFKRIFGMKALVEFLKNFLKVLVIGIAVVMTAMPAKEHIGELMNAEKAEMLSFTQDVSKRMMIAACIVLFLLSIVDYVYQRMIFMKSMRMTKQEVKDEYKNAEGDPHVKQKLKAIRREKARRRMMANVPKADVIITNPTHYAIALRYDAATMAVPKVVAKGVDEVAARIREVAEKHKVPLVRNPPLARILYDTTEIDDEIPAAHYQAVAKIIGYIYRLKGKPAQKPAMAGKVKKPPQKPR